MSKRKKFGIEWVKCRVGKYHYGLVLGDVVIAIVYPIFDYRLGVYSGRFGVCSILLCDGNMQCSYSNFYSVKRGVERSFVRFLKRKEDDILTGEAKDN